MNALVEFKQVKRVFQVRNPATILGGKLDLRAVQDVSFSIAPGQTLGLVGESGCGKSTVGQLVLGLLPPSDGEILFDGAPLTADSAHASSTVTLNGEPRTWRYVSSSSKAFSSSVTLISYFPATGGVYEIL